MKLQFNADEVLFLDKYNKLNFLLNLTSNENDNDLTVSKYILEHYSFSKQLSDNLRYEYYRSIIDYSDEELKFKLKKAANDYFYNNISFEDLIKEYEGDDLIYVPMKELIRIEIMRRWCAMCLVELDKNKDSERELKLPEPPDVIKYN